MGRRPGALKVRRRGAVIATVTTAAETVRHQLLRGSAYRWSGLPGQERLPKPSKAQRACSGIFARIAVRLWVLKRRIIPAACISMLPRWNILKTSDPLFTLIGRASCHGSTWSMIYPSTMARCCKTPKSTAAIRGLASAVRLGIEQQRLTGRAPCRC